MPINLTPYITNDYLEVIVNQYDLLNENNLYTIWMLDNYIQKKFKDRKSINYHHDSMLISAYMPYMCNQHHLLFAMLINKYNYAYDPINSMYYFNVSMTSINKLINGNKRTKLEKYAINDLSREQDLDYLMQLFDNKCAYCRVPLTKQLNQPNTVELDHIKSLSEQYNNSDEYDLLIGRTFDNIVVSCKRCNREKSSSDLQDWLRKKFPEKWGNILYNIEFTLSQETDFLFS